MKDVAEQGVCEPRIRELSAGRSPSFSIRTQHAVHSSASATDLESERERERERGAEKERTQRNGNLRRESSVRAHERELWWFDGETDGNVLKMIYQTLMMDSSFGTSSYAALALVSL
ncbi:hypothetical protein E1301_Tti006402 [Triplophysa tibetana]|uniref:Uncharacterized protein n=1 Tax=Triplophysa tibetana TaxID=1572043 RepID=A0A5A9NYR3_9TELE|nr:hypothetical protein E1301_Tti006402 [Triplophysa tibetana]